MLKSRTVQTLNFLKNFTVKCTNTSVSILDNGNNKDIFKEISRKKISLSFSGKQTTPLVININKEELENKKKSMLMLILKSRTNAINLISKHIQMHIKSLELKRKHFINYLIKKEMKMQFYCKKIFEN